MSALPASTLDPRSIEDVLAQHARRLERLRDDPRWAQAANLHVLVGAISRVAEELPAAIASGAPPETMASLGGELVVLGAQVADRCGATLGETLDLALTAREAALRTL